MLGSLEIQPLLPLDLGLGRCRRGRRAGGCRRSWRWRVRPGLGCAGSDQRAPCDQRLRSSRSLAPRAPWRLLLPEAVTLARQRVSRQRLFTTWNVKIRCLHQSGENAAKTCQARRLSPAQSTGPRHGSTLPNGCWRRCCRPLRGCLPDRRGVVRLRLRPHRPATRSRWAANLRTARLQRTRTDSALVQCRAAASEPVSSSTYTLTSSAWTGSSMTPRSRPARKTSAAPTDRTAAGRTGVHAARPRTPPAAKASPRLPQPSPLPDTALNVSIERLAAIRVGRDGQRIGADPAP